jgi:hypothetical protein
LGKWKEQAGKFNSSSIIDKTSKVRNMLVSISFQHVFRELNEKADKLSKEALLLQEGLLVTAETAGGGTLPDFDFFFLPRKETYI